MLGDEVWERRLTEALDGLWGTLVDPREALVDEEGFWSPLGEVGGWDAGPAGGFATEEGLDELRRQCRALALTNEFAINGHENRISYIVGAGHTYRAAMRRGVQGAESLVGEVQGLLDEFLEVNRWSARQQEIVRRRDRDGEVFLRFFVGTDGMTRLRFVEPGQVRTPPELVSERRASFGILTDAEDVECVLSYFVDGEEVSGESIQHRKANVDENVKRGLPLFYPVRKNLRRAEKLLRNMSVVAEIQSAIALIRKHRQGTRTAVQQFVDEQAEGRYTDGASGKTTTYRRYGPGTILDAPGGVEYEFPVAQLDAARFVTVLQAELRAIASRLVMPEFMLSSDASNANYASTMVAEGPAVKMFQRLQAEQIWADREVMWRVVRQGVESGRIAREALTEVEIQVQGPPLAVREMEQEERVAEMQYRNGILSAQTWSMMRGLDYDQEQQNREAHHRMADNEKSILNPAT
jgi:hypothetical protein